MKIVFTGDCQAYALSYIYARHIAEDGQQVGWVDVWNEHGASHARQEVGSADVIVSQVFSGRVRVHLEDLFSGKTRVYFPDVRGNFLWPYGNISRVDNPQPSYKGGGPYDTEVGDSFLNKLILKNVSPEDALDAYLDHDVVRHCSVDRIFEIALDQQRNRDEASDFTVANYILANFRTKKLFETAGHLSIDLFCAIADELYSRLGATKSQLASMRAAMSSTPFEKYHSSPIHPKLSDHFGLEYAGGDARYHHVQEGRFSFSEWVLRYMRNEWSPALHEGCLAVEHGDYSRGLTLINRGLFSAPRSALGYFRKAEALFALERYPEAAAAAERAAHFEPNDGDFRARSDFMTEQKRLRA